MAHYSLGLFHDNNGRYVEAVPHYEEALRLGLRSPQEAETLAWLATSLFKMKREADALERLQQSRDRAADSRLLQFLDGLEKRIERRRRATQSKKPVQITEELLAGGSVNTIVRIGATVRRTTGPWTPTIHALLNYLEAAGFAESPRVLGIDDKGREILTYIDGQTIGWTDWPRFMFSNQSLTKLGSLLRRYHDAVRGFHLPEEAVWRNPLAPRVGEIIRHGDLSPFNTVWRGAKLVGIIDWDFAAPGLTISDLAYLAWYAVPLSGDRRVAQYGFIHGIDRASRLETLCKAYGAHRPVDVIDETVRIIELEREQSAELARQGLEPWAKFAARGDLESFGREAAWIRSNRALLLRNI